MSRLQDIYKKEIVSKLKEEFGYKNILEVPRIEKVVVNVGVGKAVQEPKVLEKIVEDLTKITGQLPKKTKATKSIAGFKLREGMEIGVMATLRGERMYEFIDRLVNVALPRVRDFRGISAKAFDGKGNYSLGIKEHFVFPEISVEEVGTPYGFQINVITSAKTNDEARSLLRAFGFPFKK